MDGIILENSKIFQFLFAGPGKILQRRQPSMQEVHYQRTHSHWCFSESLIGKGGDLPKRKINTADSILLLDRVIVCVQLGKGENLTNRNSICREKMGKNWNSQTHQHILEDPWNVVEVGVEMYLHTKCRTPSSCRLPTKTASMWHYLAELKALLHLGLQGVSFADRTVCLSQFHRLDHFLNRINCG